jgi:hypothetical protein
MTRSLAKRITSRRRDGRQAHARPPRLKKFLARHPENKDVDLTIRSEDTGEKIVVSKFFVPSPKMTLGRATMLHSEFPITPTWRAN